MIGQMLCFLMPRKATEEQIEKIVSHTKAGSFFVSANGRGEIEQCTKIDDIAEDMKKAAVILINCKISVRDYCGGNLRVNWEHIATFWRGEILRHPKLIFTSFGDPYKLYEYPYLKTYINAYSCSKPTQKAFVKAILGEIPFRGKSPVWGYPKAYTPRVPKSPKNFGKKAEQRNE